MMELSKTNARLNALLQVTKLLRKSNIDLSKQITVSKQKMLRLEDEAESILSQIRNLHAKPFSSGAIINPELMQQQGEQYHRYLTEFNNKKVLYVDASKRVSKLTKKLEIAQLKEQRLKEKYEKLHKQEILAADQHRLLTEVLDISVSSNTKGVRL